MQHDLDIYIYLIRRYAIFRTDIIYCSESVFICRNYSKMSTNLLSGILFQEQESPVFQVSRLEKPLLRVADMLSSLDWAQRDNIQRLYIILFSLYSPGPREIPGCTGSCQLTYCHACYLSEDPVPRPETCPKCKDLRNYLMDSECFCRWADCIEENQPLIGHPKVSQSSKLIKLYILAVSACEF